MNLTKFFRDWRRFHGIVFRVFRLWWKIKYFRLKNLFFPKIQKYRKNFPCCLRTKATPFPRCHAKPFAREPSLPIDSRLGGDTARRALGANDSRLIFGAEFRANHGGGAPIGSRAAASGWHNLHFAGRQSVFLCGRRCEPWETISLLSDPRGAAQDKRVVKI